MSGWTFFYLLVFPGLLFTAVLGLLVGWVDRKVSARVQFRVGPPLFQNFNDFFKLLGKETIIVKSSLHSLFVLSPLVAFGVTTLIAAMLGVVLFYGFGFGGDLLVMMYLLMIYSVMVILGGSATGNVYSSLGAGREIKLLLADELAFILVCLVPIIKAGYLIKLEEILSAQVAQGAFIGSFSGALAFIVGLLCIQAKMTLPPFHIPEAETEIVEGPLMEYSGPLLGFWKLNQAMQWVVFPFLLIILFLGGFNSVGWGILWSALKYLGIVVIMILIKNTNPRIRIDTALKFFWKYLTPVALLAVILAVLGV
ncbi:MAG: NADH-quinone oxidoreductase subunit H [Candidatus Marinimicrobia bacterium]|jgi:NADH-quinone oxidoreductase subunit H|nr:NADH-quinone oxidoreductase subunit H [Candidatus Neomarinimicrobiota bacterium]MCK9560624.1 NADH-quinone oxidoreductase subunit H [Candidatus Neomarinimicrobiota bacterium]MDD5231440.1 NADH-quinone oxidoreductase subunit H [Candidatus Neomarinimicrobiota bacterium]MDD5540794.1 NADH-quinone oxidoreductase subunit H [Candidatus Neomarinimicrobiota bacterium]